MLREGMRDSHTTVRKQDGQACVNNAVLQTGPALPVREKAGRFSGESAKSRKAGSREIRIGAIDRRPAGRVEGSARKKDVAERPLHAYVVRVS